MAEYAVGPPETMQRVLKGHILAFPQNTQSVASTILPLQTNQLVDVVKIVFMGSNSSEIAMREALKKCKVLTVRCSVITAWLIELVQHNPRYNDIVISQE